MEPISIEAMTSVSVLEKYLADLTTQKYQQWVADAQMYQHGETTSEEEPSFHAWQRVIAERPEKVPDPIGYQAALTHAVATLLARSNTSLLEQLGQRKKRCWIWAWR
jgi:hypothetical protein